MVATWIVIILVLVIYFGLYLWLIFQVPLLANISILFSYIVTLAAVLLTNDFIFGLILDDKTLLIEYTVLFQSTCG